MTDKAKSGPLLVVCANLAWNLVNFRSGLIKALIADGFRVLAVAPADAEMEARLLAMGCTFEAVPIDAMGLSPFRDLGTLRAFTSILRRHRPAAWLSWTIKPNVYGALAAARAGVPAFPNVSGLGTAFIRRNLLTTIVKQLYRASFRNAPAVFFQNADDRQLFISMGLVRRSQARLLPGSGIDPREWSPSSMERNHRGNFLMLARVVADKGVREFAEAAARVRRRYPETRFRLMGFLDVANRTAISVEEVQRWVDEGAIEYAPPVNDVRPAIAEADFVVLPSYREGLSRVLLEAASLGRPCITTDTPGCRDIVKDGENGFLCAPRDAQSLEQAIEKALIASDSQWQAMARAGRQRVIDSFSLEQVTRLYRAALSDAGVVA